MRLIVFLVFFLAASVQASTVYVSDNLRVGVRPEPDSAYTPVGVVLTGMELEVLERRAGYLKIKTADNMTGWIKDIYVVEKPPAVILLKRLQKRYSEASGRLKEQEDSIRQLQESNLALNKQVESLKKERNQLQLMQAKSVSNQESSSNAWLWGLLGVISVIVGGFVGGIQWYRHQAMKRLGGLRV